MRFKDRADLERRSREAARYAYLGPNSCVCRILGDRTLHADPADRSMVPHLALDGFWEPWVTFFLLSSAEKGMSFMDIGSGFGYYTAAVGKACAREGSFDHPEKLVAVDICPRNLHLTHETAMVNGLTHCDLHNLAATREPGVMRIVRMPGTMGANHARRSSGVELSEGRAGQHAETVMGKRMDSLIGMRGAFDLLKIDAEGGDWDALRGAESCLKTSCVVVLEHCKHLFGMRWGADPDAWEAAQLEWAMAAGFDLRFVNDEGHAEPVLQGRITETPERMWNIALVREGVR